MKLPTPGYQRPPIEVSVIIVSFNTLELLLESLESLAAVDNDSTETIVVDNGSLDGSIEAVRSRYPEARLLVNCGNVGFARAVNRALDVAHGEFVLLLNPGARLLPGCLEHAVAPSCPAGTRLARARPAGSRR